MLSTEPRVLQSVQSSRLLFRTHSMASKKGHRCAEPRKKGTRNGWLRTQNERSQNGLKEPNMASPKYGFYKVSNGNQRIVVRFINTSHKIKPISLLSVFASLPRPPPCRSIILYSMPYAAKAKTQQFSRRKPNLMKKADQLARLCHADVALIIRRNGRYYTYRSTDHEQWPPTISEIVSNVPLDSDLR